MRLNGKDLLVSDALGLTGCSAGDACFIAGTMIDTPDGPRPIESVKRGDMVWAWSSAEQARVARAIVSVKRDLAQVVCRIEAGDHTIAGVTPDHPFFHVDTQSFVPLRDLPSDARLRGIARGQMQDVRITGLSITERPEPSVMVLNLSVEGPEHTYVAEGLLVHNKSAAL